MIIAMIIGYIAGAVLAFHASRWLLDAIANRAFADAGQRKWIRLVGGLFGAIALAPAIFLAMMFGGLVGGSYDREVAEAIGLGANGALLVLAVRVAAVTTVTVTINAAVGAGFGFLMARALQRDPSLTE